VAYDPAELRDERGRWTTGGSSSSSSIEHRVFGPHQGPIRAEVISLIKRTNPLLVSGNLGLVFHNTPQEYRPDAPDFATAAYDANDDKMHLFANEMSQMNSLERQVVVNHELFHRLDYEAGKRGVSNARYSSDPGFRKALAQDIGAMSKSAKKEVAYFTHPTEAYAELSARMGLPPDTDERLLKLFPKTRTWLRNHLIDLGF
jgi:hypothetical protein